MNISVKLWVLLSASVVHSNVCTEQKYYENDMCVTEQYGQQQ
jgi:hypothetical protein